MIAKSILFQGHRCFKNDWAGFDSIKPINVIIGRNNSGKSHLLDLVEALCADKLGGRGWKFKCRGVLNEETLRPIFRQNTYDSKLGGDAWNNHGVHFIGSSLTWEVDAIAKATILSWDNGFNPRSPYIGDPANSARIDFLEGALNRIHHVLNGTTFRRLLADRDIRAEEASNELTLGADGRGASNIIRRYILTSNPQFPRNLIQRNVLSALNEIFGSDGQFTEIQVKFHDERLGNNPVGTWEVYLGEERKGLIPLSNSGSGLKTVFLVLLNLLVIPEIDKKAKEKYTFAFEELENNLHPALLRRLFQYLERYAVTEKATVFLTTHASTALDLFGVSADAQIIHVTHDGEAAKATTVAAHFDRLGVISELGVKPSDLLQANGIIWVEGPSDCIYINRWLDVYSGGKLQEGRDYQCAFYGGSLLARTQFKPEEEAEKELVNLFRINPNVIVVCDGDRASKANRVKDRVRRIQADVRRIPRAHIWVTEAREIENYVPGSALAKAVGLITLPDPTQYELFFPRKGRPRISYVESRMNRKGMDKMDLAILSIPHMDKVAMVGRFDWEKQMAEMVKRIQSWNG